MPECAHVHEYYFTDLYIYLLSLVTCIITSLLARYILVHVHNTYVHVSHLKYYFVHSDVMN